ncbi:lactococcin 972 family bacteriocin [Lactobacillus apis]|uniref:lactococcin 972 family bacteriocin n=1 Tax=Lactobacillus apis TaxID=303541 RepID=UPI00242B8AF2|nr:lactococcin 972 family bacteriocin [Lactobacillus apis]
MKNLKKLLAGVVTVATLGVSSIPVLASANGASGEEVHSGMVVDSNSNSGVSPRATQERDGGTWNYGVGTTYVWSYYYHKTRLHRSSVKPGIWAALVSSNWTRKGVQSRASAPKASRGNYCYYDIG